MSDEYWADVVDFPDYLVSDMGRVMNRHTERILAISDNGSKNLIVTLRVGRQSVVKQLRWVVAETYLEPPPSFDHIPQHIDRDYTNCRADNLVWMPKGDVRWRIWQEAHGWMPDEHRVVIEQTGEEFDTIFDCATHVGGTASHIHRSMRNRDRRYKGFTYAYTT